MNQPLWIKVKIDKLKINKLSSNLTKTGVKYEQHKFYLIMHKMYFSLILNYIRRENYR